MSDIAEMLASLEPAIQRAVTTHVSRFIEPEDAAQELRIAVLRAVKKYDPEHASDASFKTYVESKLRFMLIDIYRRTGAINRKGERRKVICDFSCDYEVITSDGSSIKPLEAVDQLSDESTDIVDWSDLIESIDDCGRDVQIFLLRARGETLRAIGDVMGISESRVSQIITTEIGEGARQKLRQLLGAR